MELDPGIVEWVTLSCPGCGHEWEARLTYCMGTWSFDEGRDCPRCKTEGKYE